MRPDLKTQIVTKLKNPNHEKLKKTQIATRLENSNCDKTKKSKSWKTKKKKILIKLKKN